jgi:hypothetical protein
MHGSLGPLRSQSNICRKSAGRRCRHYLFLEIWFDTSRKPGEMTKALAGGAGSSLAAPTGIPPKLSGHTTHARIRTRTWGQHTNSSTNIPAQKRKISLAPSFCFAIKQWQASGDRVILFMDHNEHVNNGPLGKELGDKEGLDLREAIVHYTGKSPGATFFRGLKPIDGMWISSDLDIRNACVMPFGYGVGNYQAFILNLLLKLLIGIDPVKIVQLVGRRLNSQLPKCSKSHIDSLKANIVKHCLLKWLFDVHTGLYSNEEQARRIIVKDEEGKAYMQCAEKICRKKNAAAFHSHQRP